MAKISELSDGGSIQSGDLLPIARGNSNFYVKGSTITSGTGGASTVNISGVVVGGASASSGSSTINIATTLATISSGISNSVLIDDGSNLLKKRSVNPFIWNTTTSPVTANLVSSFIPKAISANGLVNSVIKEDNVGNIGIGINPNVELTVHGQISATEDIISTLDLISNQNLSVSGTTVLGKDSFSPTTINGIASFPNANSAPLGIKIGSDVNLYRYSNDVLRTDDSLSIGTLNASTASNDVVVHESGLLKTRSTNPAIWNTTAQFLSGAGTSNFISKYITPTSLGNSSIYESGSNNVGIGTSSPNEKLTVVGNISASGTGIIRAKQSILGNAPLSATLNVEGSYLQTVNGNGDYVIRIQDGTGRTNHYWNTMGGTSPTFTKSNEGARKILFGGGNNYQLFEVCTSSFVSPTAGVAGDPIAWQSAFVITTAGNVGIGTIPDKKLTIAGDVSLKNSKLTEFTVNVSTETFTAGSNERVLVASDSGSVITISQASTSNGTIRVPSGLPVGYSTMIVNRSTQTVGISSAVIGGAAIVNVTGKKTIASQYGVCNLIFIDNNTALISGDLL